MDPQATCASDDCCRAKSAETVLRPLGTAAMFNSVAQKGLTRRHEAFCAHWHSTGFTEIGIARLYSYR